MDEREGQATSAGDLIAVSSPPSPALLCPGNPTVLEKGSALREGSARVREDCSALALRVGSAMGERRGEARSGNLIAVSSPPSPILCWGNHALSN